MLKSLFLTGLLAAAAAAGPLTVRGRKPFKCGTNDPTPKQLAAMKQFAINEANAGNLTLRETTTVDVYMHVVAPSKDSDSYLSQDDVDRHFNALNSAYADSNFDFTLKDTDWTVDKSWSKGDDESGMKKELHQGDHSTLNVYLLADLPDDLLGQCTFPDDYEAGADDAYLDGCKVADTDTSTTVHEVGHWFGLLHTFTDGCSGDGDHISDTPPCTKTFDCPKDSDTCTDDDYLDPIENWMGYNNCQTDFTSGQFKRMQSQWDSYRA